MARFSDVFRGLYSFLVQRPQSQELVAEYIVREHSSGRSLDDILGDAYVKNRCTTEQVMRVLEQPEVVHALGSDIVAAQRSKI